MCVYISKQQGLNRCDCSKVTLDAHIHLLRGTPRLAGACKRVLKECTYSALEKNIGYKLLCRCPAGLLTDWPAGPAERQCCELCEFLRHVNAILRHLP
jgi:hypothetical protein